MPTTKTSSGLQLWVRFGSNLFLIGGAITLIIATQAPPNQDELAVRLAERAIWALGLGVGIAFAHWVITRFRVSRV